MRSRTYKLNEEDMDRFLSVLSDSTDPLMTHMTRLNIVYGNVSQNLFKSSMGTLSAMMQAVAMFPDLHKQCQDIYDGINSVLEAQEEFLEVTKLIGDDVLVIHDGLREFLDTTRAVVVQEL